MADITLNSAVRSNLRTLQATTELMSRTEERLSTGKKVNSALDNPTNFFTAQSLERRAGDLSSLLDSVSNSVQTLEAADNGISAITDLVEQMKSTARSAQQSSSAISTPASFKSAEIVGATADNILGGQAGAGTAQVGTGPVGTAAVATTFTGADVFGTTAAGDIAINGATVTLTAGMTFTDFKAEAETAVTGLTVTQETGGEVSYSLASGADLAITGTAAQLQTIGAIDAASSVTTAGSTNGTVESADYEAASSNYAPASSDYQAAVAALSGTLTVSVGGNATSTITFGTASGEVSSLDELNEKLALAGAKATLNSDGELTIQTANQNEADSLKIGGTLVSTDGAAETGEIFTVADPASATVTATTGETKQRVDYKNDYNDLRDQISKLAKDASYNGVNLLAGDDLKVVFNEDASSFLDVAGVDVMDTLGLGEIGDVDFLDSSSIDAVVDSLNTALDNLDSLSGKFGSQLSVVQTRQDFTKDMVGTLEGGANLLTAADTNEEAANLATLQTRQSLIISSLSISTQQEQGILQLLR